MVDFNGVVKTFLLPEAFSNKFLTTNNEEVIHHFSLVASKIKEEKILQSQLKIDEYELELLK